MVQPGYRKRTIFLLVALLLVRFWFGQTFELSGQEAYLWLQGHGSNLSSGYWEQGPLVPWLIWLGTRFFGDTELGVRFPAAVIACCTGFILFYLARHWFNPRAAFWTVVLFVVIPFYAWKLSLMTEAAASIGLMALAMLAFCRAVEEDKIWWWAMGGAVCGLALLVALPNVWWLLGGLLYFVVNPGHRPRLTGARVLGTIVFTSLFLIPVIHWWMSSQVADVAHTRILKALPFSHPFSLNQGFNFIWMEIFYLCPPFFVILCFVLWRLGWRIWEDPRYCLLVCIPLPGLIWENCTAFFHEGRLDLIPALFLPLVLLAGCYLARLTALDRITFWGVTGIIIIAGLQSLAGLNPLYFVPSADGHGYRIKRTQSGENITDFCGHHRNQSWRNLADAVQSLQRDLGATLVITDNPESASALSFYLPRNPQVYVEQRSNIITQFDFWPGYDQTASPNDSAIFIGHSTDPARPADPPSADIVKSFASVTQVDDPPLPDFEKSWDIWNCQRFIGSSQPEGDIQNNPMPEHDALPK
jgi:undecaprenyl-diphosphatase